MKITVVKSIGKWQRGASVILNTSPESKFRTSIDVRSNKNHNLNAFTAPEINWPACGNQNVMDSVAFNNALQTAINVAGCLNTELFDNLKTGDLGRDIKGNFIEVV